MGRRIIWWLEAGKDNIMLGVNLVAASGAKYSKDGFLWNFGVSSLLEKDINRGRSIANEVMVCRIIHQ